MKRSQKLKIMPIGIIKDRHDETKAVRLYNGFLNGLKGVEDLEYIWIIFWMNRLSKKDRNILLVHPKGDRARDKKGVFALRSPMRPNPIGLTRVKLIERTGNTLIVKGLDSFDGTPIIDIKSG